MGARRPQAPVIVLVAALLAACSPSASESPTPSGPASKPAASVAPSESLAAAACDPGVICNGPLAAGAYVSETTGVRVEFTLDEHDWSGLEDTPGDGFSLFLADVDGAAISVVSYSGEIFTNSCRPDAGTLRLEDTSATFMNMLTSRTGITATTSVGVEVGGQPALQTDLTTSIDSDCMATGNGRIWLWTLPVHGDFHFNDQEQARVMAVDGGSATVILVLEAGMDVEWDHLLEHFTELVETMAITPL